MTAWQHDGQTVSVLGVPRGGTTLRWQLLSGHPNVFQPDETRSSTASGSVAAPR